MTVASETNRSGPYTGNGVTTAFNYGFRILAATHMQVVLTENDVDTVVDPANYSVAGVGDAAGGSITMATAPTATQTLTIIRAVPFTQTTDLENQGAYYAEDVEAAFDLSVMRDQELQEQIDRSLKIPVGQDSSTLDGLIADVVRLNDSVANVDTVATNIANVNTAATNIASIIAAPGAATAAAASATAAATSETNAAASETSAAGSATSATASATSATASASAASTSETNAASSATAAAGSATAAAGSATSASTSATNAATSATNAAGSATAAATSATNAAASETAAAGSASAAATSATNAATSETNAAASAADAANRVPKTSDTGSAVIPAGTTAQRDGVPVNGYFRYNSTTNEFEGYAAGVWGSIGGGGGGFFKGENGAVGDATTGPGDIFRINEQTLNTSTTIDADENASATGPLAIATGVTLTVTSGGSLAIL